MRIWLIVLMAATAMMTTPAHAACGGNERDKAFVFGMSSATFRECDYQMRSFISQSRALLDAERRSSDAQVKRLSARIAVLGKQLLDGAADRETIKQQLLVAEAGREARLVETDPIFAQQRAELASSLEALWGSEDRETIALLRRYGAGDGTALALIKTKILALAQNYPHRLIEQRAFAVLAANSSKSERERAFDVIATYEATLRSDPADWTALSALPTYYTFVGAADKALALIARREQVEQRLYQGAPWLVGENEMERSGALGAQGQLSDALAAGRRGVTIYRSLFVRPFSEWQHLHPTATEPEMGGQKWRAGTTGKRSFQISKSIPTNGTGRQFY